MKGLAAIPLLLALAGAGEAPTGAVSVRTVRGAPQAIIVGPTESRPGDLVVLKSEGSRGDRFSWHVEPEQAAEHYFPVERGRVAIFASRTSADVVFLLVVEDAGCRAAAVHVLKNREGGPGPDPDPPDPDPPEPGPPDPDPPDPETWAAWAKQKAEALVDEPNRQVQAADLAKGIRLCCKNIEANRVTSLGQARAMLRWYCHRALGPAVGAWSDFADALEKQLTAHAEQGNLTTVAQAVGVWGEIADGLEKVK